MIGAMIAKQKISSAFDALNNRDFEAFLAGWRDDCTFIYPGDLPVSGKMEGKHAIEKWFKNFLDQFPASTPLPGNTYCPFALWYYSCQRYKRSLPIPKFSAT